MHQDLRKAIGILIKAKKEKPEYGYLSEYVSNGRFIAPKAYSSGRMVDSIPTHIFKLSPEGHKDASAYHEACHNYLKDRFVDYMKSSRHELGPEFLKERNSVRYIHQFLSGLEYHQHAKEFHDTGKPDSGFLQHLHANAYPGEYD